MTETMSDIEQRVSIAAELDARLFSELVRQADEMLIDWERLLGAILSEALYKKESE